MKISLCVFYPFKLEIGLRFLKLCIDALQHVEGSLRSKGSKRKEVSIFRACFCRLTSIKLDITCSS